MTTLNLADEHARMGKISLNLERHGDDEEVTAFAIPVEVMLAQPQLDALMGRYFHRSIFNTDKTGLCVPVDGFRRCDPLSLPECYEDVKIALKLGEDELTFEGCKAQKFVLEPQVGGLTKLRLQIYLRPGIGDENLALQEYQHQEVGLQVTRGKLARKKDPQAALPLPEPPNTMGEHAKGSPTDDEQDAIDRQAAALAAKPGDAPIDGTTAASRAKSKNGAPAA